MEFSSLIPLACRSLKLNFSPSGQILLLFYNILLLLQFLMKTLMLSSSGAFHKIWSTGMCSRCLVAVPEKAIIEAMIWNLLEWCKCSWWFTAEYVLELWLFGCTWSYWILNISESCDIFHVLVHVIGLSYVWQSCANFKVALIVASEDDSEDDCFKSKKWFHFDIMFFNNILSI